MARRRACRDCERLNKTCDLHRILRTTRRLRPVQVYPSKKKYLDYIVPKPKYNNLALLGHHKRERVMSGDTFRINLAKLLSHSQAPAGLTLELGQALLTEQNGNVRKALKAAKRRLGDNDNTICEPVPDIIDPTTGRLVPFKNLRNVQNSCFMAATITACFAHWDAWDALLMAPQDNPRNEELRDALRSVVNGIRRNTTRVTMSEVQKLRQYILPGYNQEDAREFLEQLLSKLCGPMLPFGCNIMHDATRETSDESTEALRTMDLTFDPATVASSGSVAFSMADLLDYFFFGTKLTGLRRKVVDRDAIVNAWCVKLLLPEYTPYDSEISTRVGNLRRNSFDTLALPMCFKRYMFNHRTEVASKIRNPVLLPVSLDFSRFVSDSSAPGGSASYTLRLKSVVCHMGNSLNSGHYVSYTYDLVAGWTRWDDCSGGAGIVDTCAADIAGDRLPMNKRWREEISRDCYLAFYELLPGDGNQHPKDALDASISGEIMDTSSSRSGGIMETIVEKVMYDDEQLARALELELNTGNGDDYGYGNGNFHDYSEYAARKLQENMDGDYARNMAGAAEARRIQANMDAEYARDLSHGEGGNDAEYARNLQEQINRSNNNGNNLPRGSNMPPPPSGGNRRNKSR